MSNRFSFVALGLVLLVGCSTQDSQQAASSPQCLNLLNVSYDPTREFYNEFNEAFRAHYRKTTGQDVTIEQSHGGAGKQARAVMDGLEADVVTLALAYDIDVIAKKVKLLPEDWQSRLPNNSSPYTSTIVFLVRKGNPKQIKNWDDLVKDDVSVITPNPKTSGGARWNYLAAWAFSLKRSLGDFSKLGAVDDPQVSKAQADAKQFVGELFKRVPVLDSGARGSTNTFIQRGIGDVLLTWENEAYLAMQDSGDQVEIVVPPQSILAEPPVTVVDANAKKHGTFDAATAYLQYLYSPEGQALAAKHYYRPFKREGVSEEILSRFSKTELFTIEEAFGGWAKAQATHFDDGGIFDQLYQPGG